jgi:hypothetical protein
MKSFQEHIMAQSGLSAAPSQVEAIQADGCGVESDVRDSAIRSKYEAVRRATRAVAASMSAEDQMVQSCPEASPMKWHQAHTTWFFETFVLRPFVKGLKPFREEFYWLFNSYYNSLGEEIPEKSLRSVFSRLLSMRFLRSASILTRRWTGFLRAVLMRKRLDASCWA